MYVHVHVHVYAYVYLHAHMYMLTCASQRKKYKVLKVIRLVYLINTKELATNQGRPLS